MRCRMSAAHLAIECGRLEDAAAQLPPVEDLLHRAIECGAMVDPWNILGFGGQYSLFPAVENSVHDHRVDDLLDMLSDIFMLYVEVHKAAAAAGQTGLRTDALAEPRRAGPVVGPVRQRRDRLGRRGLRPGGARVGRERGRGAAGVARRGRRRRRRGLLAPPRRALPRPQGLRPGRRYPAGPRRFRGRHGAVGAMAQPGGGNPAGRGGFLLPRSGAGVDGGPLAEPAVRPGLCCSKWRWTRCSSG